MITRRSFNKRFPELQHLGADERSKLLAQARYETFRAPGKNSRFVTLLGIIFLVVPITLGCLSYVNAAYLELPTFWLQCLKSAVIGCVCFGIARFYSNLIAEKVIMISARKQRRTN